MSKPLRAIGSPVPKVKPNVGVKLRLMGEVGVFRSVVLMKLR